MKTLYLVVVLVGLLTFGCKSKTEYNDQPKSKDPLSAQALREKLLSPNASEVLIIAHRGDWRNAPENSLQAIANCINMGVDMVEIDVRMTRDSQLVIIHDATLDRTTTDKGKVRDWTLDSLKTLYLRNGAGHPTHHRIPTLKEAMLTAKDKILVNLDKCYEYFDLAYKVLQETGTTDQVVMKGKVPVKEVQESFGQYLDEVPFMPIVDLEWADADEIISAYQKEIHPAAFELLFSNADNPELEKFYEIRKNGSRVWVNTLWESLNAGYEDDMAVENPDSIYGFLIEKGVNMIQTDRPEFLLNYLRSKGLHN
jgi:glycerophosphoryl diester phosphodiesterase